LGLLSERKTLETGYDIGDPKTIGRLKDEASRRCPSKSWFSLVCTAVSSVQNLNMRSWEQIEKLRKKRQRCRKHLRGAIEVIWCIADVSGGKAHFYFGPKVLWQAGDFLRWSSSSSSLRRSTESSSSLRSMAACMEPIALINGQFRNHG